MTAWCLQLLVTVIMNNLSPSIAKVFKFCASTLTFTVTTRCRHSYIPSCAPYSFPRHSHDSCSLPKWSISAPSLSTMPPCHQFRCLYNPLSWSHMPHFEANPIFMVSFDTMINIISVSLYVFHTFGSQTINHCWRSTCFSWINWQLAINLSEYAKRVVSPVFSGTSHIIICWNVTCLLSNA